MLCKVIAKLTSSKSSSWQGSGGKRGKWVCLRASGAIHVNKGRLVQKNVLFDWNNTAKYVN